MQPGLSDEIHKFANLEINPRNERGKGFLGFPTLITALCASHAVEVNPTLKIRPTIDARYILQFCVNPEENPQEAQQPPSPPHAEEQQFQHGESSAAQPTNTMIYDQLSVIRASMEQMQLDLRADRAYFEQE